MRVLGLVSCNCPKPSYECMRITLTLLPLCQESHCASASSLLAAVRFDLYAGCFIALQRFSLTRALQGLFPNGQMCFWWMSVMCFYDNFYNNKRALNEKQFSGNFSAEWNNEKFLRGSFNHGLTILCLCNRQQSMEDSELLLEKYQNKSLGQGHIRQIHWIDYCFTNAFKTPENTHSKLVLMKANFGSKFV